MARYIWKQRDWPNFKWRSAELELALSTNQFALGRFLGRLDRIGFKLRNHAGFETLSEEILKSAAIEGESLNREDVRSSVARRMDIVLKDAKSVSPVLDARAEMILDASRGWNLPMSEERLLSWHAALFPTGYSGLTKISVGRYRDDREGPMQVVSRYGALQRVHFEAPGEARIATEMASLVAWLNADDPMVPPLIKTALAHLRFLTIHPFEDGNGRLARALTEWMLARAEKSELRFYSLSSEIEAQKSDYYDEIEHAQRNGMDVTRYLAWFVSLHTRAVSAAEENLTGILAKADFWQRFAEFPFTAHQRKMLNLLFDGFEGHLTSSKWAKICKVSQDTASREIAVLLEHGILTKLGQGRSTHYVKA